jgi:hypothetical protein
VRRPSCLVDRGLVSDVEEVDMWFFFELSMLIKLMQTI